MLDKLIYGWLNGLPLLVGASIISAAYVIALLILYALCVFAADKITEMGKIMERKKTGE